jgi:hypothetical protein
VLEGHEVDVLGVVEMLQGVSATVEVMTLLGASADGSSRIRRSREAYVRTVDTAPGGAPCGQRASRMACFGRGRPSASSNITSRDCC